MQATQTEPSFGDILKHPKILENLTVKMGFAKPTPIQVAVATPILEGRNLFAGAKTGSGKTIAFLAPLCERIFNKEIKMALVLAPTRELVLQIDEEAMNILDGQTEVVSVPLYGGVPVDSQVLALRTHKPRLLIATPGRTLDLVQEGVLKLGEIEGAVLDEADRMCDMGFAPQVQEILDLLPNRKQTLLFSATLPKELNEIMSKFCPDAFRVQVDAADASSETIEHNAVLVSKRDKMNKLVSLVSPREVTSLVFTRTRNRCDQVYRALSQEMKGVGILHAGYSMPERERTIRDFRDQKIRCLIATDVVSRGIDVEHITHVVHYDIPDQLEDYIHRSGRSGRAGRSGETFALFDKDSREEMNKFKTFGKKIHFQMAEGSKADSEKKDHGRSERHSQHREKSHGGGRHGSSSSRDRHSSSRTGGAGRSAKSHSHSHSTHEKRGKSHSHSHPHSHSTHRKHSASSHKKTGIFQKTKNLISSLFGRKK